MVAGKLEGDKIVAEGPDAIELFNTGWYGNLEGNKLELDTVEAVLLSERVKLEIEKDGKKISFKEIFQIASEKDERFAARYMVYKDLRDRGLPVRMGFKGSDFRVYDRGAKPGEKENIKWIVFASSEDYPCALEQLGKAIKLSQNIRATALWAVVDNDEDVTFYIISNVKP